MLKRHGSVGAPWTKQETRLAAPPAAVPTSHVGASKCPLCAWLCLFTGSLWRARRARAPTLRNSSLSPRCELRSPYVAVRPECSQLPHRAWLKSRRGARLAVFAGGSGHLHHTGPHFGDIHVVVLSRVTGCRSAPPVSPPAGDARHVSSRRGHGVDGQHPSGQAPPRGTRDKTRKPPDSLPHGGVISGVWESLPLLRLVILANKRMTDTEFCHHESFDAGPSARSCGGCGSAERHIR